jgi:hypothetical protein
MPRPSLRSEELSRGRSGQMQHQRHEHARQCSADHVPARKYQRIHDGSLDPARTRYKVPPLTYGRFRVGGGRARKSGSSLRAACSNASDSARSVGPELSGHVATIADAQCAQSARTFAH